MKKVLIPTIVGVSLFALLMNLGAVVGIVRSAAGLIVPMIVGIILAMLDRKSVV